MFWLVLLEVGLVKPRVKTGFLVERERESFAFETPQLNCFMLTVHPSVEIRSSKSKRASRTAPKPKPKPELSLFKTTCKANSPESIPFRMTSKVREGSISLILLLFILEEGESYRDPSTKGSLDFRRRLR